MKPHHHEPHEHHFPQHWQGNRWFFFLPFLIIFGGITLFFIAGIGVVIYFVSTQHAETFRSWALLLCGIPFLFFFLTSIVGSLTFRRYGKPMSDIFSAIDAIAEGDLSVRVRENYPRQFGQLAKKFNYMVSELERAEQQRRNLTADIAHELRTPLHIIQGNLEGMLDGVYEPSPENITNTLDETKLLARLVSDLQTLSLAEAGQLPLHPSLFLIADLVNDLTSSFSAQAASLGIELRAEISDPSKKISADYDRLDQVFSNLIANAIRHTSAGGKILIKTETTPTGVRVAVQDTGEGISPAEIPFIFDRFWRGSKSRTERTNSGLGLAITKQLVNAHHGTIDVQSELHAGTKFIVELPDA